MSAENQKLVASPSSIPAPSPSPSSAPMDFVAQRDNPTASPGMCQKLHCQFTPTVFALR